MPELPDVEIFKKYVDSTSLHKKVNQVEVKDSSVLKVASQTLKNNLEARTFEKAERRGKHLFVSTNDQKWLALHFGMTGSLYYSETKNDFPAHTLVLFHFDSGGHLAYGCQRKLGAIDVAESPDQFCEEHDIGEDALEVGRDTFRQLLGKEQRMIKSVLMDQSVIAGLGNIYSDEVLYQTKIHPKTKTSNLSDEQIKNLYQNIQRILKTSVNNQADPEKLPTHYLITHRKEGAECPECGSPIKRIKISGRGSYFCPNCQKKG